MDDGNFISPFVRTSEGDMKVLTEHLYRTLWEPQFSPTTTACRLRIIDLGCGDGAALLYITKFLCHLWERQWGRSGPSLVVEALGVDLDEELIAAAREKTRAESFPSCTSVRFQFSTDDIRSCDRDTLFPSYTPPTTTTDEVILTPLLFLYLLPDALESLQESLREVLDQRGYVVVSNRWPVPYFKKGEILDLGDRQLHVYQRSTV